jgi:hypothetical protein
MQDVEPQPALTTKTYRLPRELLRPAFQEISIETLLTVEPELGEDLPDIEYIRDAMEEFGPGLVIYLFDAILPFADLFSFV